MSKKLKKNDNENEVKCPSTVSVTFNIKKDCHLNDDSYDNYSRKSSNHRKGPDSSYPSSSESNDESINKAQNSVGVSSDSELSDTPVQKREKKNDKARKEELYKEKVNEMKLEKNPEKQQEKKKIKKRSSEKVSLLSKCVSRNHSSSDDLDQNKSKINQKIIDGMLSKKDISENDIFIVQIPKNYDSTQLLGAKLKVSNGTSFKVMDICDTSRDPQAVSAVVYLEDNNIFGVKIQPSGAINVRDPDSVQKKNVISDKVVKRENEENYDSDGDLDNESKNDERRKRKKPRAKKDSRIMKTVQEMEDDKESHTVASSVASRDSATSVGFSSNHSYSSKATECRYPIVVCCPKCSNCALKEKEQKRLIKENSTPSESKSEISNREFRMKLKVKKPDNTDEQNDVSLKKKRDSPSDNNFDKCISIKLEKCKNKY